MCADTCGWCGLGLYCTMDGDVADDGLVYCIPKDIFKDGDDDGCTSFIDESELLVLNNEGRDTFTI